MSGYVNVAPVHRRHKQAAMSRLAAFLQNAWTTGAVVRDATCERWGSTRSTLRITEARESLKVAKARKRFLGGPQRRHESVGGVPRSLRFRGKVRRDGDTANAATSVTTNESSVREYHVRPGLGA